jgi:hypothetical protein
LEFVCFVSFFFPIFSLKGVNAKYLRNRRRAIKFDKNQNKHRDRYPPKEEEGGDE